MNYFGLLNPKLETPALKSVLTEKGVRLMALGASGLNRKTNVLRTMFEANRHRASSSYST